MKISKRPWAYHFLSFEEAATGGDDDDDDDEDKKVFLLPFLWHGLVLFPARTIARDPHHCKSLTCCKQGLNLRRT